MDVNQLSALLKLKEKLMPVKEKCDMEADLILKDMQEVTNGLMSETLRLGRIYARSIKLLATQRSMYKKIKRALVKNYLFNEDEIALDINELISMEGRAKAIVGPIVYNSNIPLEYLTNLEFTWFNADFSKLYNSEWIKNLRIAFGPLTMGYISSPVALNITADTADFTTTRGKLKLPDYKVALNDIKVTGADASLPLDIVEGNIHVTEDEEVDTNAFMDIRSFDGFVYYEKAKKIVSLGEVFSLEEYLSQATKYLYK